MNEPPNFILEQFKTQASADGRDFYYRFYRRTSVDYLLLPASFPPRIIFSRAEKILTGLFLILPLMVVPLFPRLAKIIYPRLQLLPRVFRGHIYLRPPVDFLFFQEMLALLTAVLAVVVLQTGLALFLRKKGPWSEAITVGPLLALAVYGVMRGFQADPSDWPFHPLPALAPALIVWLGLSLFILYPHLRRVFSL